VAHSEPLVEQLRPASKTANNATDPPRVGIQAIRNVWQLLGRQTLRSGGARLSLVQFASFRFPVASHHVAKKFSINSVWMSDGDRRGGG
jgi:hypothetical protein